MIVSMDTRAIPAANGSLRVLLVEDDPALGRLVERSLRTYAAAVTLVRSGREALEAAVEGAFDAIACDISLPDLSGIEVIAHVREALPNAGIVAITGLVDVEVAVESLKAGADDFLGKPFDPGIFWHVLNKAVDSRHQRMEAERAALYRRLAYTDTLTGAPNRRFIDELLEDGMRESLRNGRPLSVAYVDIDNFKLLNDFVGHTQGDLVLTQVSAALTSCLPEPGRFGRFGGDEFVVVFPGLSILQARRAMAPVREAITAISVVNDAGVSLPVRISCGFASHQGGETARDLVAEAEDQMYLDKTPAVIRTTAGRLVADPSLATVKNFKALRGLVRAIDRRDSYTRFHSDHATNLARRLGERAGLAKPQLQSLVVGGPIHDLGKIVVPDEILRKPGPLTAHERALMEEHPVMGAAITAAVSDYEGVVNLVRHHHERFDGSGYPGGLRGEAIALPTRVFGVCDAYSAMTTDRPYRKGLSIDQALSEIELGAGVQFDPDLARFFMAMIEDQFRGEAAS